VELKIKDVPMKQCEFHDMQENVTLLGCYGVFVVGSLVTFYDSLSVQFKGSGLEYGTYRLFQKSLKQLPACTAQCLRGAVAATA
jgi:hypothetical protein